MCVCLNSTLCNCKKSKLKRELSKCKCSHTQPSWQLQSERDVLILCFLVFKTCLHNKSAAHSWVKSTIPKSGLYYSKVKTHTCSLKTASRHKANCSLGFSAKWNNSFIPALRCGASVCRQVQTLVRNVMFCFRQKPLLMVFHSWLLASSTLQSHLINRNP